MYAERDRQAGRRAIRQKPDFQYVALRPGALGGEDEQERLAAARLGHELADHRARVPRGRAGCRRAAQQPAERPRKSSCLMSTRG